MKKFLVVLALLVAPAMLFAQNVSTTQMQLVNSTTFTNRLQYILSQQAIVVKAELLATTCHPKRSSFADVVINSPAAAASQVSVLIAGSTNVLGTVIVNVNPNLVDSSASDAAILSQIATLWNVFSKCDTGS